jgi:uncharacterized membrane protein (UPF0127 family)
MGSGNAAVWLIAGLAAAVWPGAALAACAETTVELRGPGGQQRFTVEVADDDAERARGLMFREEMAMSAGMLFVYEEPRRASFWMKNTLIPLDMIFADATGTVQRVHENAIPHDETPIDGGEGVLGVLEINGGLARRLGIGPGTVMRHPAFAQGPAAWPCE